MVGQKIGPTNRKALSLPAVGWSENGANKQESAFHTGYWLVRNLCQPNERSHCFTSDWLVKFCQPIRKLLPYWLLISQKARPTNSKALSLPTIGWSENCANQQESAFIVGCWLVRKLSQPIGKRFHCQLLVGQKIGQPIGKGFCYQLLAGQKIVPTNRKALLMSAVGWSENGGNQLESPFLTTYRLMARQKFGPTNWKALSLPAIGWSENLDPSIGKRIPYWLLAGQKIRLTNWKSLSLPAVGWSENFKNTCCLQITYIIFLLSNYSSTMYRYNRASHFLGFQF